MEQPSGTVTLVFTDIEGSTRLLRELGSEEYGGILAEHRDIVREAFGAHRGYEVDTDGDAFFFTFASAADAVAAVSEAMTRLESTPVRLRVGVHTGTPALDGPNYLGLDVHLAARVGAAGHGGQVLLTGATRRARRRAGGGSRRAPLEGLRCSRRSLPARRPPVPAAEDDLEHEPPASRVVLRRPRARTGGGVSGSCASARGS